VLESLRSIKLKGENVSVSSMQDDMESKGAELAKQRSAGFQI
jgi:hypothetical protein